MSWRFIIAILLVALGISAWGGLRLGEWLVAHGPAIPAAPERPELAQAAVLDADGRPYTAQPPQPLVDGRLAVPERLEAVEWEIPTSSLDETTANEVIEISTTPITMVEAQQIAAAGTAKLNGIADVGDLIAGLNKRTQPVQPIEPAQPDQPVAAAPAVVGGAQENWQASLRQALRACEAASFFDRPSCSWAARNKYCTPNNAWGQIEDCPARSF